MFCSKSFLRFSGVVVWKIYNQTPGKPTGTRQANQNQANQEEPGKPAGTRQTNRNQTNRNQNQLPNASYAGETAGEQTPFGYYDDWDQVLAARGNDTFVAPTRDLKLLL